MATVAAPMMSMKVIPRTTVAKCECGRIATWWIETERSSVPVPKCTIHTALLLNVFVAEHNIR